MQGLHDFASAHHANASRDAEDRAVRLAYFHIPPRSANGLVPLHGVSGLYSAATAAKMLPFPWKHAPFIPRLLGMHRSGADASFCLPCGSEGRAPFHGRVRGNVELYARNPLNPELRGRRVVGSSKLPDPGLVEALSVLVTPAMRTASCHCGSPRGARMLIGVALWWCGGMAGSAGRVLRT